MAILQQITLTKSGSAFADVPECQDALNTSIDSADAISGILTALANEDFTLTKKTFDVVSQTMVIKRTWDEDAYNTFATAQSAIRATAKSNAEADGWTTTESVETV
jgi:hypothetical protein